MYLYDDSSLTNKTAINQSEGKSEGNINGGQVTNPFLTAICDPDCFHSSTSQLDLSMLLCNHVTELRIKSFLAELLNWYGGVLGAKYKTNK